MKNIKWLFMIGAVVLFFFGLYRWLWVSQIDYAAFFFALASISYSVYLHSSKEDRPN